MRTVIHRLTLHRLTLAAALGLLALGSAASSSAASAGRAASSGGDAAPGDPARTAELGLSPLAAVAADSTEGLGPDEEEEEAGAEVPSEEEVLRIPRAAWEDSTAVARVGGAVITAGDLAYALEHGRAIDRSLAPDSLRRAVLEKVINQVLLVQEGYRRRYDRAGPLVGHVDRIADQLAGRELRRRIYGGKIEVTEAEMRALYERYHYTLRVRHLSVDRKDLAEDLLRRLKAGEDFAHLAKRYSEHKETALKGGDMGEVTAGRMIIDFEDAVFPLAPGQLTAVIKGKGEHYKIFKLESKERDRTPSKSLDEMRPALGKRVRTRKSGQALYAWQLSMFDKYEVKIDEENYRTFAEHLRDNIATWEAVRSVAPDSLPQPWIFSSWPPEMQLLEIARFRGGRFTVGEFNKSYRDMRVCPTCLWRDSDVQLRQFVLGQVFDKLVALEKREIRLAQHPALSHELVRRKEERLAQMVAATLTVLHDQVSDEDAREYWEEHSTEYVRPAQAKVRRIVVDSEDQARDILKRLEGGADFAALAERFSKDETTSWRGGETDFFGPGPGNMQGMADVALRYAPGELIPPFKSGLGWEVVVVLEKQPPAVRPLEEVKAVIKTRIATQRTDDNLEQTLADFRRTTPIEIDEAALARVPLTS
jgi:parvulin-like peptidyl-prolyl isomerase